MFRFLTPRRQSVPLESHPSNFSDGGEIGEKYPFYPSGKFICGFCHFDTNLYRHNLQIKLNLILNYKPLFLNKYLDSISGFFDFLN